MNWNRILFEKVILFLLWIINGLFCKILDLVPRHQEIVARIFNEKLSFYFTPIIGIGEIVIALLILFYYPKKWLVYGQILLILTMNCIELLLAKDLLLWGVLNGVFALVFCFLLFTLNYRRNEA